jgi:hypothetical protein
MSNPRPLLRGFTSVSEAESVTGTDVTPVLFFAVEDVAENEDGFCDEAAWEGGAEIANPIEPVYIACFAASLAVSSKLKQNPSCCGLCSRNNGCTLACGWLDIRHLK